MLVRIFRVHVHKELKSEFEPLFQQISLHAFEQADGFISAEIAKPEPENADEYLMISYWRDKTAIENSLGRAWREPHIPEGMERFVQRCWVHHYTKF